MSASHEEESFDVTPSSSESISFTVTKVPEGDLALELREEMVGLAFDLEATDLILAFPEEGLQQPRVIVKVTIAMLISTLEMAGRASVAHWRETAEDEGWGDDMIIYFESSEGVIIGQTTRQVIDPIPGDLGFNWN